ncbi:MAG: hypothetical protein ACFCU5_01550 [Pleurocapsa sp.]
MKSVRKNINIETVLKLAAIAVFISIFLKAIIDIDTNYDTWWYHLPFAARIWGIVPPDIYLAEDAIEYRYEGFPLLANFVQGFFWRITGRVQSANLVCFGSLILYLYFLKAYCRIPLYLSAIALLTIPTVITHVTTSFVDLPGNVAVSILVMMTYLLYTRREVPTTKDILIIILAAAAAVNIKPQLQPLTFVILCFTGLRILWLNFRRSPNFKSWLVKAIPLGLIASLLIFATPVKNIVIHGNPFYPIKIQVAGIVLNHKLSPATYQEGSRPQKWFNSVFEINTPTWWSTDQWNGGNDKFMDRGGGFFGNYVIFNLILLLCLFLYQQITNKENQANLKRATTTAIIFAIAMSVIPANFPQSHELRYFMFWMICLVSFNLYLIAQYEQNFSKLKWLKSKYVGLVYALFLTIVLTKVGNFYAKPQFFSLQQQIQAGVKPELLQQIQPGDRVCLIARAGLVNPKAVPYAAMQHTFLYSAYFHPQLDYSYSIKARSTASKCENRKIIPQIET